MKSDAALTRTIAKRSIKRTGQLPANSGIALRWMNLQSRPSMKGGGGYWRPSGNCRSSRQGQEAGAVGRSRRQEQKQGRRQEQGQEAGAGGRSSRQMAGKNIVSGTLSR